MTTLYDKILEAILRNTFKSMATQEDKNASKVVEEICKEEMKRFAEFLRNNYDGGKFSWYWNGNQFTDEKVLEEYFTPSKA